MKKEFLRELFRALILTIVMVVGLIIYHKFYTPEPLASEKITKSVIELQPIYIQGKDWKPLIIQQGNTDPYIPQDNDSLRRLYIALFEKNSETVFYDTAFKDTNYTEHLSFSIRENKLDKFSRQLTIINTNTEKIKQQTFGLYGGFALHKTADIINPAFLLTYQPRQGSLYTLGKDATGSGFIFSAQFPLFRKYK